MRVGPDGQHAVGISLALQLIQTDSRRRSQPVTSQAAPRSKRVALNTGSSRSKTRAGDPTRRVPLSATSGARHSLAGATTPGSTGYTWRFPGRHSSASPSTGSATRLSLMSRTHADHALPPHMRDTLIAARSTVTRFPPSTTSGTRIVVSSGRSSSTNVPHATRVATEPCSTRVRT